jgi:hypothetical protein
MPACMREKTYEKFDFGQLALQKLQSIKPVPENFRLYVAGVKPEPPKEWTHMEVIGAEYREATKGINKGKLCVMVPNSKRGVKLTRAELEEFRLKQQAQNLEWKSISPNTRSVTVQGRHFCATRAAGKDVWLLIETQRCMHEHGSATPVEGMQWSGIKTANLSEAVCKALGSQE